MLLQTVLDGAQEHSHEIELVFLEAGPWPIELRNAGWRVEVIPVGRLSQVHRWLVSVIKLARILRRRQPDLIVNWMAKTQLYGSPAAVIAGMGDRVVWLQHLIPVGHWIDRCATALPARSVGCCSRASAEVQVRMLPKRPTFVFSAGVRLSDGQSNVDCADSGGTLRLAHDTPVVGLVGRLQPWKGQDRLLAAQALLRGRGHDVHTVIVGGDANGFSSEYAASLEPLIGRLGLSGAVTMTGQVADAGTYIDQMDILVNASDPEPFGIVLLEAMARGVAVVAVNSGGPAEFIEDGRTGVLARSGEPAALADALERLLADPVKRAEISRAGREHCVQHFTATEMRKRLFERFESLAWSAHRARVPDEAELGIG